jgi:tripartite-type tricarboxylate transporter receptor subunit TctC
MIHSLVQRFVHHLCHTLVLGILLFAGVAQAQPDTVKMLVGFPPGGGTDTIARILADKLKDQLGSTVIVENHPGAGGQIAAKALKAAPADGSTFFLSHDHTVSILPLVVKTPGFDPVHDFVAVAGFATFVNALAVSGGTPAKSMNDYVAWVRRHGAGMEKVGVPSPASVPEFLVKLIDQKYVLNLQAVAYQGTAPMMADMLSNQIHAGVGSMPEFIENHKAGRIRVLLCWVVHDKRLCPMFRPFPSWVWPGLKTCRITAFLHPLARPRRASIVSPARWPKCYPCRTCVTD